MARATGTVKWFSDEKGYGFIGPDEGDEEVFVYYTDVEGEGFRSLTEGERVSYEAARAPGARGGGKKRRTFAGSGRIALGVARRQTKDR